MHVSVARWKERKRWKHEEHLHSNIFGGTGISNENLTRPLIGCREGPSKQLLCTGICIIWGACRRASKLFVETDDADVPANQSKAKQR